VRRDPHERRAVLPLPVALGERTVRSVANLTRADGEAFMALAARTKLDARPVTFGLERANDALEDLRRGAFDGAAVLLTG